MSKWMVSYEDLIDEQINFLDYKVFESSNQWINGFAGSGKSVLLMHALATIKEREPDARIHVVYFTHSLRQMYRVGMGELRINARGITFGTYIQFERSHQQHYDYIFCDEVQDLTESVLIKMKNSCRKLFISGDPNQSIYDKDPQTGNPVIDVNRLGYVTSSEETKLTTVHRLTASVIKLISSLMPSMGILKAKPNAKKIDVTPRLAKFDNALLEVEYIMEEAFEAISNDKSVVVIFPNHAQILKFASIYCDSKNELPWKKVTNKWGMLNYDLFNEFYHRLKIHVIGNNYGDLVSANRAGKVVLMTYYSVKGLDFDSVFMPFLNAESKIEEEALFMVALSRSKNTLYLTHTDEMHPYLEKISDDCEDISSVVGKADNDDFDDFIF
ncbi:hypothetical protein PSEHALCIP103_02095 [Pseudoalteromonas haloplanktis]|uniref:DNA 3'-5' helicase II n=1 Tax=Pseudoalteromonas haloplanktis TaxID=228 RepID=A0A9W4QZ67_PSEHA|nr:UvrD-helicase domain-containing protein [Pseudoalteromonas haloplanktis]CAH9059609.1 hypothetical protein PSEHALCIP103_02095 [Pseudoalteromonas haloplanktis]